MAAYKRLPRTGDYAVLLRILDVEISLNSTPILRGITLEADIGDFIGIIGPNGSGKTTLLRTIAGILKPVRGIVLLDAQSVHDMPGRERAKAIAYLDAEPPRVGYALVEDYVATAGSISEDSFEVVGLKGYRWRRLASLSSGEKRRTMIAYLLERARSAKVLLVDEPTVHLDLKWSLHIMHILRRLALEGRIVIAASHDLVLLPRYVDKLIVLSGGKVIAAGRPSEVLTSETIRRAYGVEAEIVWTKHGPIVVPLKPAD